MKGRQPLLLRIDLSAIQHANLILVLDEGEVIERGTHEELMGTDGWYKEMYLTPAA